MRFLGLVLLCAGGALAASNPDADSGWPVYGHDAGGTRYSPLKQINSANVTKLRVAWTYHTGALDPATSLNKKAAFESTPVLVEGSLYLTTPFNQVIALDPASGAEKWKFDPEVVRSRDYSEVASRGVAVWADTKGRGDAVCRLRLFEGTIDARLLALDAKTGKLCTDFGAGGSIDLSQDVALRDKGQYQVTSAPTVLGDLVITGSSIGDNRAVNVERGIVRAYDARTGKLRWSWDPIPWANQPEPRTGAANAWGTFAADPKTGLVFIPTGSAGPDYYGGKRPGDNRHANSVVALRGATGELVWAFQVVHHDLWDYDVASQPVLIEFQGKPAVAVTTKIGNVFVLDRATGKPLMTVEERAVPKSDMPGEDAAASQPFPGWSPMVPQRLTAADAWGPTPDAIAWCKQKIDSLRNEGLFTPPSLQGTLVFPGNAGGVNWGSAAWDPGRNLLFANTNRLAAMAKLIPREKLADALVEARKNGDEAKQNRFGGEFARQTGTPYAMYREWLISPVGMPCNPPPWGALVAFDLNTGKLRWETPLGEMKPGMKTGTPNLGGPMATAGGLVFAGAAMDTYLRAFAIETGAELWKGELPASAQSIPMTYAVDGKQYVVVCAGGHGKLGTKMGDAVVAFALEASR